MSSVRWTPPARLIALLEQTEHAVDDLSPAMEKVSKLGYDEIQNRLETGDPSWPELSPATVRRWGAHRLGIGRHGGFASSLRRGWSKRNAVVMSAAPHAHLFDEGTKVHRTVSGTRVHAHTSGRRHVSRPLTKKILRETIAETFQPPRNFMYFSRDLVGPSGRAWQVVIDHFARPFEAAA